MEEFTVTARTEICQRLEARDSHSEELRRLLRGEQDQEQKNQDQEQKNQEQEQNQEEKEQQENQKHPEEQQDSAPPAAEEQLERAPPRAHRGEEFHLRHLWRSFSVSANLTRHRLVHSGRRDFSCDVCGRSFTQAGHLKTHRAVHSATWAFICNACGKGFRQRGALLVPRAESRGRQTVHLRGVWQDLLLVQSLKRHQRTHGTQRAHTCAECGKSFTSAQVLKTHCSCTETAAAAGKPFLLRHVGRGYSSLSYLRTHGADTRRGNRSAARSATKASPRG
ncbi:hypothetical protein INR49_022658 [Caranx melampygus]|nr:hypothetical protein INR49_022658 [Caranx melampygus]